MDHKAASGKKKILQGKHEAIAHAKKQGWQRHRSDTGSTHQLRESHLCQHLEQDHAANFDCTRQDVLDLHHSAGHLVHIGQEGPRQNCPTPGLQLILKTPHEHQKHFLHLRKRAYNITGESTAAKTGSYQICSSWYSMPPLHLSKERLL